MSEPQEPAAVPDYELPETLAVDDPAALGALSQPTRNRILAHLLERAATTKQLADVLGLSPGTVGHHLGVLADAGLVRVVRTRKVRAVTERYYGRTARTFLLSSPADAGSGPPPLVMLREAVREARPAPEHGGGQTIRYARIPRERADEWIERLGALAAEFAAQPRDGDIIYGLVAAVFPTDWATLPPEDDA
jgi:DNA-binding transcriptional ArsR family regulator